MNWPGKSSVNGRVAALLAAGIGFVWRLSSGRVLPACASRPAEARGPLDRDVRVDGCD